MLPPMPSPTASGSWGDLINASFFSPSRMTPTSEMSEGSVVALVAPATDGELTRTRAGLKTERSSTSAKAVFGGASKRESGGSSSTASALACAWATETSGSGANRR